MLLGLIGTSGEALQLEARTIVDALKSIGCNVQVFTESCREAERVLRAYLKSQPSERHGRTHTAVLKGEVERNFVKAVAVDVEEAASKFGVTVRDFDLESYPNDHRHFDHERNTDIFSFLGWDSTAARDHDAFAVTAIMRLRKGKHRSDPLRNSHVFISSNEKLVRKARDYCIESQLIYDNQCGPVVDIRDMATVAWLRTGFENSERLPISHMLAQCERVLRVRKDVIDAAVAATEKYSPEQREQFELLLQDNRAVNFLMDTASGSPTAFDPDNEQLLLDGMLEAAIKVAVDDATSKISEKEKVIRNLRAENKANQEQLKSEYEAQISAETQKTSEAEDKLAELERLRERDRSKLLEIEQRHNAIAADAVRLTNRKISLIHFASGIGLLAIGLLAAVGIFGDPDQVPAYVLWASRGLSLVGLVLTIQALRGKSVPGLKQILEQWGMRKFLAHCVNKGVPKDVAENFVSTDDGRLVISDFTKGE